jgi:trehalose-phosphatase
MIRKPPVYLFSNKPGDWKKMLSRLSKASAVELFLDYDGTLTPICQKPSAAVLAPGTELLLEQTACLPGLHLTIVTGRSMEDIKRFVPIENIAFIANHGFHILHEGKEWLHPDAVKFIGDIKKLNCILSNKLGKYPGANIENKQLTLSIHYRSVAGDKIAALRSVIAKTVHAYDPALIITKGKKVLEIRPDVRWGKGDAIVRLLRSRKQAGRAPALFIGDDQTDEDAFLKLQHRGITISVGRKKDTNAKFYVRSVEEVIEIIRILLLIRKVVSPRLVKSRAV